MTITRSIARGTLRRLLAVAIATVAALFGAARTANATSGVCVHNVSQTLSLNGVVAAGAVTASCSTDAVWSEVAPNAMESPDVGRNANFYIAHGTTGNRLDMGIDLTGDPLLSDADYVYVLFDADNDNTWSAGDFYLKVNVSTAHIVSQANPSQAACSQNTGPAEYFGWDTTHNTWLSLTDMGVSTADAAAVNGQIQTKLAYDYDTSVDAETNIWNLEISVPISFTQNGRTYFPLQTTGTFFGVGAYVFMDDAGTQVQTGTVLRWPDSMKPRMIDEQIMDGTTKSLANELADANLSDKCFDVTFVGVSTPWAIGVNGATPTPASPGDQSVSRTGVNLFRVRYLYTAPGSGQLSNPGNMHLDLTPFGASGSGTPWSQDQATTALDFNQEVAVDFTYDFAHAPSDFQSADFVCGDSYLQNFAHDDDTSASSNHIHTNLNYLMTSSYTQSIALFGSGLPKLLPAAGKLKPGQGATVYLEFRTSNDPSDAKRAKPGLLVPPRARWIGRFGLPLAALLLSVLGLVALRRIRPGWVGKRSLLLVPALALVLGFAACHVVVGSVPPPVTGGPAQPSGGRWTVKNANELGLKPVQGKPNFYELALSPTETKKIDIEFHGEPLPYQTQHLELKPADAQGAPGKLSIPVKAGRVATVIAFGQIDLDGPDGPLTPTTAAGRSLTPPSAQTGTAVSVTAGKPSKLFDGQVSLVTRPQFLLASNRYRTTDFAGTLIGSFNSFKTSFVVGDHASFLVPDGAQTLQLAVNSVVGKYNLISGVLQIYYIDTPEPQVPTHAHISGSATYDVPISFNISSILTTLFVHTYVVDPHIGENGVTKSLTEIPWGGAAMSIYASHAGVAAGG